MTLRTKNLSSRKVVKQPHELLEFTFPVSEVSDLEAVARAMLGVKHGSFVDVLGLPAGDIARKMEFWKLCFCSFAKSHRR